MQSSNNLPLRSPRGHEPVQRAVFWIGPGPDFIPGTDCRFMPLSELNVASLTETAAASDDYPPTRQVTFFRCGMQEGRVVIGTGTYRGRNFQLQPPYRKVLCRRHAWPATWVGSKRDPNRGFVTHPPGYHCVQCGGAVPEQDVLYEFLDSRRGYPANSLESQILQSRDTFDLNPANHAASTTPRHREFAERLTSWRQRVVGSLEHTLVTDNRSFNLEPPQVFLLSPRPIRHNEAWVEERLLGVIRGLYKLKVQFAPTGAQLVRCYDADEEPIDDLEKTSPAWLEYFADKEAKESLGTVEVLPGLRVLVNKGPDAAVTGGQKIMTPPEDWVVYGDVQAFATQEPDAYKWLYRQLKLEGRCETADGREGLDINLCLDVPPGVIPYVNVLRPEGYSYPVRPMSLSGHVGKFQWDLNPPPPPDPSSLRTQTHRKSQPENQSPAASRPQQQQGGGRGEGRRHRNNKRRQDFRANLAETHRHGEGGGNRHDEPSSSPSQSLPASSETADSPSTGG